MKIIYIGSDSSFSLIPFLALIKSNHEICAFAYDDINSDFTAINSNSIQSVALNNSIPLIKIDTEYASAVLKIQSYKPEIIIVSCYPRLLPLSILSIAKLGCFNLHPSLLPRFRGPVPLFWQFREGVNDFGVTLHRITNKFDDGNIISQKTVEMNDGISQSEAMELLAISSCELIINMLDNYYGLTEEVQNHSLASYQTFPENKDYSISLLWSAKRIYNFVSAYKEKGRVFSYQEGDKKYRLVDVYSYQDKAYIESMKNKSKNENIVSLQCNPGYVRCRVELI